METVTTGQTLTSSTPSSPPSTKPTTTTTSSKSMASPKLCSPSSSPSSSSSSSSSSPSNPLSSTVKSPSTDSTILAQKEHEISKLVEEIQRLREKIKTMQHDKPADGVGGGLPEDDLEEPEAPVSPSSCNNLSPMQLKTSSITTSTSNTTTTLTSIPGHLHHSHHLHQTDLLSANSGPLNFHHHGSLDSLILGGGGDRSSSGNPLSSLNTNAMIRVGSGGGSATDLVSLESQHRSLEVSLQKLQEALRQNVDKFMNESLNTGNISRCVRELLSIHNIGQRLFARFVLGLSQGTVSELLSKPKPWDKLTEKGRDSYRKMHAWAADENCINLLKSLVPRKGKETTSFKQDDPAAEEKIRQILIEAQGAMVTPSIRTNSGTGLLRNQVGSGLTTLSNGEIIGPLGLIKSDKMTTSIIGIGAGGLGALGLGNRGGGHIDDDSDSDSERSTPVGGRSSPPLITSSSNNAIDLATGLSATSNHLLSHHNSSLVNSNSPSGLLSTLRSGNTNSSNSNSKQNSGLGDSDEPMSHDMVARIYQEELAKLIGQQVEEGFRHPHGMAFDRNPDQIRQAFTIYHQELSRLHQLVSSGAAAAAAAGVGHLNSPAAAAAAAAAATDPEVFARLAAASLVNGAGYLGLPHLIPGLNLPSSRSPSRGGIDGKGSPEPGRESISPRDLHQRLSSSPSSSSPPPSSHLANNLSTSNGGVANLSSSANHHSRSTPNSPDIDSPPPHRSSSTSSQQQSSAFSLVRPKLEPGSKQRPYSPTSAAAVAAAAAAAAVAGLPVGLDMGSNGSTSSSTSSTTPTNMTTAHGVNSNNVANNGPSSVGAEDLSASASPLQRMQSITNSLLSQSSVPPVSSTPSRPSKAVLPPITQNQFDHYNNLNTEDIVKKVKEQLSQYSISQRLFGESVLGLSQGSVSDLLARPKPWHMLTQKGREPFIRMKMFLEDDNAVHKLVASQYKIAPEKLMRTGGFAGTPIGQTGTTVASLVIGAGGSIMSSGGLANMTMTPSTVTAPTTPSNHHHHHTGTLSPNHGNTASIINTSGSVKGSPSSVSSVSAKLLTDSVVGRTDLISSHGSRSSPVYGNGSSASTPEHTPNATLISANQSPPRGSSNYLKRRYDGSTPSAGGNSGGGNSNSSINNGNNERSAAVTAAGVSYIQPSVYEMAAITQDFDTAAITTKIKETLMAHNIGQKIFGEIVLGLSQGSVSELLSKPKPWPMLSIKGREPFIRMQIWLTDTRNIERLQAIKNERREQNKKRRINGDEVSSISSTKSTSSSNHISLHVDPNNPSLHHHLTSSSTGVSGGNGSTSLTSAHLHGSSMFNSNNNNSSSPSSFRSSSGNQLYLQGSNTNSGLGSGSINCSSPFGLSSANASGSSAKKPRILFTSKQKEALRLAFSMDAYPSTATMEFLAGELDLSIRTITNWFHNHRMRLKQVPNPTSHSGNLITDEGNNGSSSSTSLPFNMGRDGMTFDPITFRVALNQRMADLDLTGDESGGGGSGVHHSSKGSYSALNLGSNYYNPNSCSSPASSSYQEDEMGTLDLSMPSKSQSERRSGSGKSSSNHHLYSMSGNRSEATEDSDDSETGSLEDSSSSRRHHLHHRHLSSRHHHGKNTTTTITMNPISSSAGHPSGELDLSSRPGSTISVTIASTGVSVRPTGNNHSSSGANVSSKGSSRRKPAIVTSSSSRRKPAMPQWVAPNIDCFGDDEEDDVDHDHHRRNHSRPNRRSIRRGDHQDEETPFSTGSDTEDEEDNLRRVNRRRDDDDDDDDDDNEQIMITRVNVNPVNQEPIRRRSSIGSNASDTNNATISVNLVNHPTNNHHEDTNDSTVKSKSSGQMTTSVRQQPNMNEEDDDKTDQEFVDDDDYIGTIKSDDKSSDNQSKQIKSKIINGQEMVLNGISGNEPEPMMTNEDDDGQTSSSPSSKVTEIVSKGQRLMNTGNSIGDDDDQIHSESSTDL